MKVSKILEIKCFVVNSMMNEDFEGVLNMMMVPVKAYDEDTNTYTIHVTFKLWSYIRRECGFRSIEILPQDGFRKCVVNLEEYNSWKREQKTQK